MRTSIDPTRVEITLDPLQNRMRGTAIHGNTPFDVAYMSHIVDNLWTGGCETGLVLPENIEHVVSLYPWEQYTVFHELKSIMQVRMYDSATGPDSKTLNAVVSWASACVDDGPTLIHCQAGLNRSNLVAALVLVDLGYDAEAAIALLRVQRGEAVLCNQTFVRIIHDWYR